MAGLEARAISGKLFSLIIVRQEPDQNDGRQLFSPGETIFPIL